ncbi:7-cyano-7-deazaguanine synthase QueC [Sulfurifustis variabilis]|uniref:7-cyano-7-deazaguanine synthase QueC n=1 Tax=Sulfurifustis variabilis TaxID=1675686 RepID=UPI000BBB0D5A|nr:7-cyano-7-deazaguanine synthase QueC [Sulfurifustis variabilis]
MAPPVADGVERAVVLLSGGLDSATTLALARREAASCHALTIDYGQRHRAELEAARRVAQSLGATEHRVARFDLSWIGGSALTDPAITVPTRPGEGIPVTYVPARNTVFLALALSWAEVLDARAIYIGVNAVDYSGYPDCRPAFIEAFNRVAEVATRAGVEGRGTAVRAPLIDLSKAEIIRVGSELGVDFGLTLSCYDPDEAGRACGVCEACRLRGQGFAAAGLADPTRYRGVTR